MSTPDRQPQTLLVGVDESDCARYRVTHYITTGPRYDCCAMWIGWYLPARGHTFDRVIYTDAFAELPAAVTRGAQYWAESRLRPGGTVTWTIPRPPPTGPADPVNA